MRQFLYLDTDIVNSIIAQAENGLVQEKSNEEAHTETESDSSNSKLSVNGTAGGSLAKLAKLEANLTGELSGTEGGSSTATSREIVNKTLHDAAFNIAYEHIDVVKIPEERLDDNKVGSYIELTRTFNFVDFDYLEIHIIEE